MRNQNPFSPLRVGELNGVKFFAHAQARPIHRLWNRVIGNLVSAFFVGALLYWLWVQNARKRHSTGQYRPSAASTKQFVELLISAFCCHDCYVRDHRLRLTVHLEQNQHLSSIIRRFIAVDPISLGTAWTFHKCKFGC
jgi:hypothetical protein